jgi:hypothetical protein
MSADIAAFAEHKVSVILTVEDGEAHVCIVRESGQLPLDDQGHVCDCWSREQTAESRRQSLVVVKVVETTITRIGFRIPLESSVLLAPLGEGTFGFAVRKALPVLLGASRSLRHVVCTCGASRAVRRRVDPRVEEAVGIRSLCVVARQVARGMFCGDDCVCSWRQLCSACEEVRLATPWFIEQASHECVRTRRVCGREGFSLYCLGIDFEKKWTRRVMVIIGVIFEKKCAGRVMWFITVG